MSGTICVAGSLAQRPRRGGHAWVFLQYLLGWQRLGWDVLFLDRLEPDMCVDSRGATVPLHRSANLAYLETVMQQFGLEGRWALLHDHGREVLGLPRSEVLARVARSAFLFNVMGYIDDEEVLAAAPRRVFLDIDPGFGQMWCALGLHDLFHDHDVYVTIGENIGRPDCTIPTCGIEWITTKQPVVIEEWAAPPGEPGRFTSVASWRGPYGPIDFDGRTYGLRAHEFRRIAELPQRATSRFEVALDIHAAEVDDLRLLADNGWSLVDPLAVAGDPDDYRSYVQGSGAELMVAKGLYVHSRSGWFSDRSACYLASGRPVLAQDTGLDGLLPLGAGVVGFSSLDEAVSGAADIVGNYRMHAAAARDIAASVFSSSVVLTLLLDRLGVS